MHSRPAPVIRDSNSHQPRQGRKKVVQGASPDERIDACHPERSEETRQFLMVQRFTNDCADPSLRSELVTFLGFGPFSGT